MLAHYNERIPVQYVSSFFDLQEKMKVWMNRAVYNGFNVDSFTGNYAVVKRESNQKYLGLVVGPIMGFFYGLFMYGSFGAIIWAITCGICGLCGIPFVKPTIVSTSWNNEPPFHVNVDASSNNKGDFKNVIQDLRYILSTDPGTSIQ